MRTAVFAALLLSFMAQKSAVSAGPEPTMTDDVREGWARDRRSSGLDKHAEVIQRALGPDYDLYKRRVEILMKGFESKPDNECPFHMLLSTGFFWHLCSIALVCGIAVFVLGFLCGWRVMLRRKERHPGGGEAKYTAVDNVAEVPLRANHGLL